jgi:predicted nucleic acid-binding protein
MIETEVLELLNLNKRALQKALQIIKACHPKVPLRSLDALHVATCDLAQEFPLCTTDARMHAAAQAMHIPVFSETLPVNI